MALSAPRALARLVHRRLGPWIAVFILIQALTGTAIVFRDDLSALLAPSAIATPIGIDAIAERARQLGLGRLTRLDLPHAPGGVYAATFVSAQGTTHFARLAADGETLSSGPRWRYPLRAIAAFHHDWLLGAAGARALALLGLGAVFIMTCGFLAWWPGAGRVGNVLSSRPKTNATAAVYWLHTGAAALTLPLTLIVIASGILVAARGDLQPLFGRAETAPPFVLGEARADLAPMIARAEGAAPGMRAHDLRFMEDRILVVLRGGETFITGRVWLRADTGAVLSAQTQENADRGTLVYDFLLRLHDGELLRLFGKLLVFSAGLSLLGVAVAGLDRARRRRQHRTVRTSRRNA